MRNPYALYRLKIKLLTPLHIGNGRKLLNEYDFTIYNGYTWRINETTLLNEQDVDDPEIVKRLMVSPPAYLLKKPDDFTADSPFFRYRIRNVPRSQKEGAQVLEQLKNVQDKPYLPGSSIKGAFRTALAWHAACEKNLSIDIGKLHQKAKFAAQSLERELFVQPNPKNRDPNYSLLRALQVSDSQPVDPSENLELINAGIINQSSTLDPKIIPVELEALRDRVEFECIVKFDLALFSTWAREYKLSLPGEEWLKRLPGICQSFAALHLQKDLEWLKGINSAKAACSFVETMSKLKLAENEFLLRLGWGTGWETHTIGSYLQDNPGVLEAVLRKYPTMTKGKWKVGSFPKSRKLIVDPETQAARPRNICYTVPLGWVLVEMVQEKDETGWLRLEAHKSLPTVVRSSQTTRPVERSVRSQKSPAENWILPISSFTELPKPGDRFLGEIFAVNKSNVEVTVPGLDENEVTGSISNDQLGGKKVRDGQRILCEVIEIQKDQFNNTIVICRAV